MTDLRSASVAVKLGASPGNTCEVPISTATEVAEVFAGFRAGRSDAVEQVRRWVGAVIYGGNWRFSDAESVSQEILMALIENARGGKVRDPGAFQKYVYMVAKGMCVNTYYRERRRVDKEDDEIVSQTAEAPTGNPEDAIEGQERAQQLEYIFQKLPAACRELWDLVYGQSLPTAEVAERLGTTAGNVRVRVHRCLTKARELRETIDSWPPPSSLRGTITGPGSESWKKTGGRDE